MGYAGDGGGCAHGSQGPHDAIPYDGVPDGRQYDGEPNDTVGHTTVDQAFSHHQGRIDFNTVNPSLPTGKDFLIHSL